MGINHRCTRDAPNASVLELQGTGVEVVFDGEAKKNADLAAKLRAQEREEG